MKKRFIKTPLVGVQVHGAKDVGTRTVNLLMGEHAGEYVRGDIMDANAVIQAFDEIKGSVDSDHDSLAEIVDEIHNLRDATDQNFEVFQEKVEEEIANRTQGDNTLDEKINAEKQERVNADTQLRNDLTTEVNRAKASENTLASNIQAEATKRENDDNTIKDNLNAEVTRATAKENEIKAEVDIINGDSATEGSFRKAIADVVGAAPEAYDTLKEIADKLKDNDDLHTAINDAIATKATTVALNEEITRAKAAEAENKAEIAAEAARAKEVEGDNALAIQNEESRATTAETAINEAVNTEAERAKGQEAYLQNLVNAKADTTALDGAKAELDKKISDETTRATEEEDELRSLITTEQNRATASEKSIADDLNGKLAQKADTTTLNEQVDTLNAAINAKQDAGNYIPYDVSDTSAYKTDKKIKVSDASQYTTIIGTDAIANVQNGQESASFFINSGRVEGHDQYMSYSLSGSEGVHIITGYKDVRLSPSFLRVETTNNDENKNIFIIDETHFKIGDKINDSFVVEINANGIGFQDRTSTEVPRADGSGFVDLNDYALKTELPTVPTKVSQLANDSNFITAADVDLTPYATTEALATVEQKVDAKQDKIVPKSIDVTGIETASIEQLRTIVNNLVNALAASGLVSADVEIE